MKKVYIVSYWNSSGVSWLINCFLELGIKTYREPENNMWTRKESKYILNENEDILKKWFPTLYNVNEFKFRNDIEVEWTHEWPWKKFKNDKIIFFVRDPRDSFLSIYYRQGIEVSFYDYIFSLHEYTHMNRIETWCFFHECWLSNPNLEFFKFEDYKANGVELLKRILNYIGVEYSIEEITKAANNSTFEKAKEIEAKYNKDNNIKYIANRTSKVNYWKNEKKYMDIFEYIEKKCINYLEKFQYDKYFHDKQVINNITANRKVLSIKHELEFNFYKLVKEPPLYLDTETKKKMGSFSKKLTDEEILLNEFSIINRKFMKNLININGMNGAIFGTGNGGILTFNFIEKINKIWEYNINIVNFFDNNENCWDKFICSKKILEPKEVFMKNLDYIIVASNWKLEIKQQLINLGVEKEKILFSY